MSEEKLSTNSVRGKNIRKIYLKYHTVILTPSAESLMCMVGQYVAKY